MTSSSSSSCSTMKSSSPSSSLSTAAFAAATTQTSSSSPSADAKILMALRTAAAAGPVSTISNSNSPAGSTTASPLLASAPLPVLTNSANVVTGVTGGLVAPPQAQDENSLSLVVGRYANIIRAQALVRSMYELEQARARAAAAARNEQLLRAVVVASSGTNTTSVGAGFVSKPTAVKAKAGQLFSSSKLKFRHYGKQQQQQHHIPMTMTNNNNITKHHHQQKKPFGMHQPTQKLKPLEPPPMLWKPTHMIQGLKNNTNSSSSSSMKTTRETKKTTLAVKAVSPITTSLAQTRPHRPTSTSK